MGKNHTVLKVVAAALCILLAALGIYGYFFVYMPSLAHFPDIANSCPNSFFRMFGAAVLLLLVIPVFTCAALCRETAKRDVSRLSLVCIFGYIVVSAFLNHLMTDVGGYDPTLVSQHISGTLCAALTDGVSRRMGKMASFVTVLILMYIWISCVGYILWQRISSYLTTHRSVAETVPVPAPNKKKKKPAPKKAASAEGDDLPGYEMPEPELLKSREGDKHPVTATEIAENSRIIRQTLADHNVRVSDVQAIAGPTITLYKVYPAKGVSVAAIRGRAEDLRVALNVDSVRAMTLNDAVGLEIPNAHRSIVTMRELVGSSEFTQSRARLPIAIGRTVDNRVKVFDLAETPHLLVAGATMQGKSVGLNVIITSLLYSKRPSELKLVFIDPKGTEFSSYKHLYSHYLAVLPSASSEEDEREKAVAVELDDAERVLRSVCEEMKERYALMRLAGSSPNVVTYNDKFTSNMLRPDKGHRFLPYIVVVVDEYAQLTMTAAPERKKAARSVTGSIISLAQMGRAAGIHVIIATQTPRRDVISGMIKANFPTAIAFKTATHTDSQVIIDTPGAEKLVGKGDMLLASGASQERIQCGYIDADEIAALTKSVESCRGYGKSYTSPYYLPEVKDDDDDSTDVASFDPNKLDPRFAEAARFVVGTGRASTSSLQTNLGFGFARAARIMNQLEAAGIVGPKNGSKERQVLISSYEELESLLR